MRGRVERSALSESASSGTATRIVRSWNEVQESISMGQRISIAHQQKHILPCEETWKYKISKIDEALFKARIYDCRCGAIMAAELHFHSRRKFLAGINF